MLSLYRCLQRRLSIHMSATQALYVYVCSTGSATDDLLACLLTHVCNAGSTTAGCCPLWRRAARGTGHSSLTSGGGRRRAAARTTRARGAATRSSGSSCGAPRASCWRRSSLQIGVGPCCDPIHRPPDGGRRPLRPAARGHVGGTGHRLLASGGDAGAGAAVCPTDVRAGGGARGGGGGRRRFESSRCSTSSNSHIYSRCSTSVSTYIYIW